VSTAGVNPYDSTTPVEMTPGGDFAWLKKTMTLVIRGVTIPDGNPGERHGHNIVAVDFGYVADSTHVQSPGDAYPAAVLGCHSCHDPHGKYRRLADGSIVTGGLPIFNSGSYANSADPIPGVSAVGVYRHLAGQGYQPRSLAGSHAFTHDSPLAVVAPVFNRSEAVDQTGIAYGRGFSEWCANCHPAMLQDSYTSGMAGLRHPAGNGAKLTADIVSNYLAYVSSGVMTNSAPSRAYSTLAPFELGVSDFAVLKAEAVTGAGGASNHSPPTTGANVMCLSCHRSHASAFPSKLRYFYHNEFMTVADAAGVAAYDTSTTENKINYGYNAVQQQNAYHGRPATAFGPWARSYCNKCHAKD
jgi:predicted CXXCH cytochrome family protein